MRSRRALLTITASTPETCQVSSIDGEWREALELLAAAEPTGNEPVARFLERDASPAAQAMELVVVTASLDAQLVDALLDRSFARRPGALVLVDSTSFNGTAPVPLREPDLLRLQASGVPVAVVQRGDDLAAKLSGLEEAYAANG
jgi:hypothetical protein